MIGQRTSSPWRVGHNPPPRPQSPPDPQRRHSGDGGAVDDLPVHVAWFDTGMPTGPAFGAPEDMTWGSLKAVLFQRREGGKDGTGFIGARFKPEPNGQVRRLGANLVARTLVVLDCEVNKQTGQVPPPPDVAAARVRSVCWAGIVSTSHNHTAAAPRYRVVLPLALAIKPEVPVVEAVAERLDLAGVIDRSKVGANSLFYCPSSEPGQLDRHLTVSIDGAPIGTDWIVMTACKLLDERRAEEERIAAAARAEAEARRQAKIAAGYDPDDSLIEKIRAHLDLEQILLTNGYEKSGSNFRHPNSTSGQFGADIKVIGGVERVYSFNASDPLYRDNLPAWCGGVTAIDAVDVITILAFAGDRTRALRELAERFGFSKARGRGEGGQGKGNGAGSPPPPPPGPSPENGSTGQNAASFRDPWANPRSPTWPRGVFGSPFDEMIEQRAISAGLDPGAVGLSTLASVSGAAPKNTVIAPYGQQSDWRQPPVAWIMIVGDSGLRKTALDRPFRALSEIQSELMEDYRDELAAWEAIPPGKTRGPKPSEPHIYIVADPNLESLQDILAATDRGTLIYRDELAGWFNSFGRYGGHAADYRQWALQGYEGKEAIVTRVKRGRLFIKVNGFTVCGFIQPDRLASYKDFDDDGFIARFIVFWMRDVVEAQAVPFIPGAEEFDKRIAQLAELDGGSLYEPTPVGIAIIRQMERDALAMGRMNDFGKGFSGFCRKLHGTLARCALILHLLDKPDPTTGLTIPDATVARAETLARNFILPAVVAHYRAAAPEAQRTRDIASWLLTTAPQIIRASDFAANVRSCRTLTTKELRDALDPLLTGGWLEPENLFQENRRWTLDLRARAVFAKRVIEEQNRKEAIRAMWENVGGTEDV